VHSFALLVDPSSLKHLAYLVHLNNSLVLGGLPPTYTMIVFRSWSKCLVVRVVVVVSEVAAQLAAASCKAAVAVADGVVTVALVAHASFGSTPVLARVNIAGG
jgi:hypothetical protein